MPAALRRPQNKHLFEKSSYAFNCSGTPWMPGGPRFGLQGQDKDILNDMGLRDANTMPIHANMVNKTRWRRPPAAAPLCCLWNWHVLAWYWHPSAPYHSIYPYLGLGGQIWVPLASNKIWHPNHELSMDSSSI